MKIFPKSITSSIWKEHLGTYGQTLVGFESHLEKVLSEEHFIQSTLNTYLCPLCLNSYFINTRSGLQGNAEFSLDHLPPKSSGGFFQIITCKKCNNDSGLFEAELVRILNFGIDKSNSNAVVLKRIKVIDAGTGEFIHGDAIHSNGRTDIVFNENLKLYNKNYRSFLSRLHSNEISKLKIEVPLFDSQKVEQALLKSAYLICFIWWGYEFVFSEQASLIRKVLKKESRYPAQVPTIWHTGDNAPPTGVSLLLNGTERLAFVVNIELNGIEVKTVASILIPNPTGDGWRMVREINRINQLDKKTELRGVTLPRVVHRIGYTISWNIVLPS